MSTPKKKQIVNNLVERLRPAKAMIFTDFTGLTATELSGLRSQLAEYDSHYTVTKNTLLKIACQQCGCEEMNRELTIGPTATLFCFADAVTPIKIIYEFSKENNNLKIKGGFLDKKFLNQQDVINLAKLPSKEILIAIVIGSIQAPTTNLVSVLQANLRNLVSVVKQISKEKQQSL